MRRFYPLAVFSVAFGGCMLTRELSGEQAAQLNRRCPGAVSWGDNQALAQVNCLADITRRSEVMGWRGLGGILGMGRRRAVDEPEAPAPTPAPPADPKPPLPLVCGSQRDPKTWTETHQQLQQESLWRDPRYITPNGVQRDGAGVPIFEVGTCTTCRSTIYRTCGGGE